MSWFKCGVVEEHLSYIACDSYLLSKSKSEDKLRKVLNEFSVDNKKLLVNRCRKRLPKKISYCYQGMPNIYFP